jgi:hypothetical protein
VNADAKSALADKLLASGPSDQFGEAIKLYGFLPGSWVTDAIIHSPSGQVEKRGEIHAGWVLGGLAIQDVWLLPDTFYGTTLRIYDLRENAWHIHWHDTLKQYYPRQIGRAEGPDIVQIGRSDAGDLLRWRFTEIERDSFHWIADVSTDEGANWSPQLDIFARRIRTDSVGGA